MTTLSRQMFQHRLDQIKTLILSKRPFEKPLGDLYTDIGPAARPRWVVQAYQWLLLYVPDEEQNRLYHPALLQAFISLAMYKQAHQCAQVLLQQDPHNAEVKKLAGGLKMRCESQLPHYTALATVSTYNLENKPRTKRVTKQIPLRWQRAWQQVSPEKLEELVYYDKQKQLSHTDKAYRNLVQSQFDELVLNYLLGHNRCVIVLSGALLELLLALHLMSLTRPQGAAAAAGPKRKMILDLSLYELLSIYTQQKLLPAHILRLCRAARLKRNYIHLGKEIVEQQRLLSADGRLCLLAVLETIDALLPLRKKV